MERMDLGSPEAMASIACWPVREPVTSRSREVLDPCDFIVSDREDGG